MNQKVRFLLFFLALTAGIYAQKCEVKTDPFSNEQVVSFKYGQRAVYFELKSEQILFEIVFNYWGERSHEFEAGTSILFKLENGQKIELKTIRIARPKTELIATSSGLFPSYGGGMTMTTSENFTAYTFAFTLTQEELKQLAVSPITVIRIPDTDEGKFIDLEANKKTKKKIKAVNKGAVCIAEHL